MRQLTLAVFVCAAALPAQDWDDAVAKVHTHKRIMVRRAAAKRIAQAGDAAIGAVRAWEKKHGREEIGLELVSSYATTTAGSEETEALLRGWATDREFYWRSQALEALANRRLPRFAPLFREHLADAAHLMRIQAARGLWLLASKPDEAAVLKLLRDADPRVRLRVAVCLTEEKDDRGLPVLVEALRQDASFLDYPWGDLGARTALRALKATLGEDFGYVPGASIEDNAPAIRKFHEIAKRRLGEHFVDPVPAHHDTAQYGGGFAIRSCRNGDLFVRWTAKGRLVFGLEAGTRVEIGEEPIRTWLASAPTGRGLDGKVICDYLRLVSPNAALDLKIAPGSLPEKSEVWLEMLSSVLDEKGRKDLAREVSKRLDQFRPRRIP